MSSDTMIPRELRQSTHGQPMNPDPVRVSLSLVAAQLDAGETVYVQLQPGDGTRYDLILMPLWARQLDTSGIGIAPEMRRDSIGLFNAQDPHALRGCVVRRDGWYGVLLESGAYSVPWSVKLLEWWFERHLWPRIDAIRGSASKIERGVQALFGALGEPYDDTAIVGVAVSTLCVRCGHRRDAHDDTIGTACLVGVTDDDIIAGVAECACIGFKAPENDEELDDFACPKGDPDCLSRDDESHDACESPPGWPRHDAGESDAAPT